MRSVKDGCSPQGQCGCCTVLVDGAPRVACVTPVRRVAGRSVTTVDGLTPRWRRRLVDAFARHGRQSVRLLHPGILCRLAPLGPEPAVEARWSRPCWPTCAAAPDGGRSWPRRATGPGADAPAPAAAVRTAADRRATLEGGTRQRTGPDVVLGRGGFADDTAPAGLPGGRAGRRRVAGRWARPWPRPGPRPGRSRAGAAASTCATRSRCPPATGTSRLQTTWVEPAYLEPDSSWCLPGGEPAHPAANGGAFGGKVASPAPAAARELADRYGRPVRVVFSREDVVRLGPEAAAGGRRDAPRRHRGGAGGRRRPAWRQPSGRRRPGFEVVEVAGRGRAAGVGRHPGRRLGRGRRAAGRRRAVAAGRVPRPGWEPRPGRRVAGAGAVAGPRRR